MNINHRLLAEARRAGIVIIIPIFLGWFGGLLGIYQAREISKAIGQVFLNGKTLESVATLLVAILIIIMLRAGISWGGEMTAIAAASKIKLDIRSRLFTQIESLGPAYLRGETGEAKTQSGELINLVTEGMDALEVYFAQYLPQIALTTLIPITILIFVFPTDPLSGLILLFTAPLLPLFIYLIGSAAEVLTRNQWLGLSRMSAYFLDVLQGLTTLKEFGRSRDQIEVIKRMSEHYRQSTMGVLKVTFLSALVLELVATLGTAIVAVEIGIRLIYGKIAFEQAFFILLLAPEFYLPFRLLGIRFHAGTAGFEASKHAYTILDYPLSGRIQPANIMNRSLSRNNTPPHIRFNNVGYSYSNNLPALENVFVDLPPGRLTALIGQSGAGKTTLTWLMLRFIQPQTGEIFVNGKSLDEIPLADWYQNLAWVPQNPYLFNDTIAANIRLTKPNADISEVRTVASLAHADEFIQDLPLGYDTIIGERGIRLSAGQAQRIALARAFLKDAPLLIIDEAASHLDPETDSRLQDSLQHLVVNRTVIVIAHHLTTLKNADKVIKLSHGKVDQAIDIESITADIVPKSEPPLPKPIGQFQTILPSNDSQKRERSPHVNQSQVVRLFKLLMPFWGRIILSIVLGFATIASGVGLMATSAYIISAAALHPSIAELQVAIVGVRFFGLSRGFFRYFERLVSHDVTFRLLAKWRVWFYQALEPLAPARLNRYHSGDLLARVIRDIGTLENFYVRTFNPPIVALLVIILVIFFMSGFGKPLAWGLLIFLLIGGVGLPIFILNQSRKLGPKLINARAQFNTEIVDNIQGMPDLLTCDQANSICDRIKFTENRTTKFLNQMARITSTQTVLGSLLANLCMLSILVLAIQMVSEGQLSGVFIGVVTLTALTCFEALQPLPLVTQTFEINRAAASRLYDLVDAPLPVLDPAETLQMPEDFTLSVKNLSFQYPPWSDLEEQSSISTFRLTDISFSLPKGKHIALVGASGAGKTTLVNLLFRFWDYQQGSILLDGQELRSYNQDDLRSRIAIISQNTYLFSASIKENLLVAKPRASEDEITNVAQQADLHTFIQSLPAGYDTWVGEHGLRLSAGERQRLAIARAFLKNSPLLILDEPTANLDPVTRLNLMNSIQSFTAKKSTITITQDMIGLETMDEILFLQNGRIIERGTHNQLLSSGGYYFRMWKLYHQIM